MKLLRNQKKCMKRWAREITVESHRCSFANFNFPAICNFSRRVVVSFSESVFSSLGGGSQCSTRGTSQFTVWNISGLLWISWDAQYSANLAIFLMLSMVSSSVYMVQSIDFNSVVTFIFRSNHMTTFCSSHSMYGHLFFFMWPSPLRSPQMHKHPLFW